MTKTVKSIYIYIISILLLFTNTLICYAETNEERVAYHKTLPVQTNIIENWPTGPTVGAQSAILMEANTGVILYAKNIHMKEYPASTTKILTALIAAEQCELDEIVSFSHSAVFDTPRDSNHIAIDVGEELTMEDSLNAILIRSANEVSFAVAEHISGTWQDFATLMNKRAEELGCLNSNFVNPNGLPDDDHYTTAYDLAMIGRAFFDNEYLCNASITPILRISPSAKQPDDIVEVSTNKLLPGKTYAYEYLVGAKTGYTNTARSSLITCAEKDGLKLICVVLKDESPNQYEDTIALFEYGFSNFEKVNISQVETKYDIEGNGLFYSDNDIFGNSNPLLSINKNDYIILPKTIEFQDTISKITYNTDTKHQAALISYYYRDMLLGSASLDINISQTTNFSFDTNPEPFLQEEVIEETPTSSFIFINIKNIILYIMLAVVIIVLILFLIRSYRIYQLSPRARSKNRRKRQIADAKKRQKKARRR